MQLSARFKGSALVLGALTVAGVACWIYQQMYGLGITGMNNGTSWGLYITCFMFFVGLSAGGLIVASSASVFHIAAFKTVALPAVIVSTVCICCAGMFVLVDLGGIARVWQILATPNFTSPLLWDVCVITTYLVINIVYLKLMTSKQRNEQALARCSRVALPIAVLVHSVTAWIFGLELSREGWYSAIMAPIFVASAMDSGLALLIVFLCGLDKAGVKKSDPGLIKSLAGLLATCIAIDAFFIGCEILTAAYPGTEGAQFILGQMTTGATAPFFWFEVVFGLAIPFVLMVFEKNRAQTPLVLLVSGLVIAGVFCKRVWLLFTSFIMPNVYGAPGIASGSSVANHAQGDSIWATTSSFMPTLPEVLVCVGVISLGALAVMILSQVLIPKQSD